MNSQFIPPQQYGGPPNRASPQSFQNVPLGPQKPPLGDAPSMPPINQSGQFPPSNLGGPMPRTQIPSNQLPPSIGNEVNSSFGLPHSKNENLPPGSIQNGPPSYQNGPPQFHNGQMPGGIPINQPNRPPSNFAPPTNQNQFAPSSGQNQFAPPPSQNQFAPPPSQNQYSAPPSSNQNIPARPPSTPSNHLGQPPLTSSHLSQFGQPPSQLGQPPVPSGAPIQPVLPAGGSSQPPLPGRPPSQPPLSSGPQSLGGQLPLQGGSQSHTGPPPLGGQPSLQSGPPLSSGPQSLGGQLPLQGGPQSHSGPPPLGGQPPLQGGPPLQSAPAPFLPPSQSGPPPSGGHLGGPHPQFGNQSQQGGPLNNTPSQFGHQPPPSQMGQPVYPPSLSGSMQTMGQPNGPNQFGPPPGIQNQFNNQMGPSKPGQGQFPPQTRPGQPPMMGNQNVPSQNPFQNVSGPYPPSSGAGPGPQMPPLPGQSSYGPNQLSNQIQGMNLSGPKQFAGPPGSTGPVRGGINGDTGPHMPPSMNQSGFVNGQQVRGPPGPGFPPMPGQPPLPGQPSLPGQPPLPGQAPMPGQGQYPSPPGGYPQSNYQQPQQIRRLDPDQMPSPIQVIQDDQQTRAGVFVTNQKGLVPPLVTTNFVVQDQGNCSPRFIRSSMYNVPISQDIMKQTAVPFSLVISPMARQVDQEFPPPIVNFGALGPVRCIRCKAYMCPFMQFVDSGRRFQCLFCMATTDVPTEYFQHLDHTGQRMDRYERPELILGTYEFVATSDYCRNNTLPKPPAMIFVIDVSYNNVKSGLVNLLCSQMKEIIQNLPVDQGQEKSNMKVGFITYNSSVHFYNIKGTLAAPQMLVVGDVQEMFMPLLDGFLCTPEESGPVIDSLMQQIPSMFGDTRETETVLLPAIQAGLEALKASECAGKLLVFHSTLPSAEAPGKLKNRDDRKLLGTDKEKTVLTPQTQAYNQLGQDCVGVGCSVDLFVFNNSYIDLATIGQVSRLTGGEVFKYTYFQADLDGERLINDIILNISRPIAFDGVMRVRTSTGVRPTDFYGHFYMSNTTDIELAAIDCDKAVGVEIKHDDKLSEEAGVYIQAALLYTSSSGQRRLRIMNLSLKTCSQMADLYRSCDLDTIINYISKQACYKLLDNNPKAVKDSIVSRAAQILAIYRKNCASPSSAGQLILPECMKLLPLYVNCLLKNDALSGGSDMTIDDRSFVLQAVMVMDVPTSVHYFYPRLIPLHDIDVTKETVTIPNPIRCTIDKMNEQGVYILENGIHMFLWFGLGVNSDFIQKLFGAPSAIQADVDRINLPELDNPLSLAVRNIIDEIRLQRHRCMRLTLVRQREKLEPVFKHFLIEDRGNDGSASYVDFLCHMHKEIRNLLS